MTGPDKPGTGCEPRHFVLCSAYLLPNISLNFVTFHWMTFTSALYRLPSASLPERSLNDHHIVYVDRNCSLPSVQRRPIGCTALGRPGRQQLVSSIEAVALPDRIASPRLSGAAKPFERNPNREPGGAFNRTNRLFGSGPTRVAGLLKQKTQIPLSVSARPDRVCTGPGRAEDRQYTGGQAPHGNIIHTKIHARVSG